MMINEYIENGIANRGAIASAVRFGRLNRSDIEELCSNPEVQAVFIGDTCTKRITDKRKWNESYLDAIHGSYGSCFNRDYLLHLCDVAEFVSKAKFRKVIIAGIIIVLVIIAGVIVCIYTTSALS